MNNTKQTIGEQFSERFGFSAVKSTGSRTKHAKGLKQSNEAVSPVIGVILMVAITVIMAAIIGSFVFGLAGSDLQDGKTVAVTAVQSTSNAIDVTFRGGPDASSVMFLNATVNDQPLDSMGSLGVILPVGTSKRMVDTMAFSAPIITPHEDHLIVTVTYIDGSTHVALDTYV